MAQRIMCCVYDSKTESYSAPQSFITRGEALRGWGALANDKGTQIGKYPADYTLFEVGTFDDQKGTVNPNHALVSLGTALEFLTSGELRAI